MTQGSGPTLDPVLRGFFDSEAAEALSRWCENEQYWMKFSEPVEEGLSGAKLAVIDLYDEDFGLRTAVLKHCPDDPYRPPNDYLNCKTATRSKPAEFANSHLLSLEIEKYIPAGNSGQFLVMKYLSPGRGYRYKTLGTLLDREIFGQACKVIMPEILAKWNTRIKRPPDEGLAARDLLRIILGERCDKNGFIRKKIDGLKPPENLLWPLAAVESGEMIAHIRLTGICGNSHGDLHPDNILIPAHGDTKLPDYDFDKFILIDLSTFADDRPLAVDAAHVLMSIVARKLHQVHESHREGLKKFILAFGDGESGGLPGELTAAIKGINDAGVQLIEGKVVYEKWRLEILTAIAACALLYVGRADDYAHSLWFLQLATNALRLLIETAPAPTSDHTESAGPSGLQEHDEGDGAPGRGGAPTPGNASAINDLARSCAGLASDLISHVGDLGEAIPPGDAETETAAAQATAERLAAALSDLQLWHEVQQPEPRVTHSTAVWIARNNLNEALVMLRAIGEQGTTPATLQALTETTSRLLRRLQVIERMGDPSEQPGSFRLSRREMTIFYRDLNGTLELYQDDLSVDIGSAALREFADNLGSRLRDYRRELSGTNSGNLPQLALTAIKKMNMLVEELADRLRRLAVLVTSNADPRQSESIRDIDDALDVHSQRMKEVKKLIGQLMKKVTDVREALPLPSGGPGSGNRPMRYHEPSWLESGAGGPERTW